MEQTITDLKNELVKQFPQFESMRDHLLVAVDAEYAKEESGFSCPVKR